MQIYHGGKFLFIESETLLEEITVVSALEWYKVNIKSE